MKWVVLIDWVLIAALAVPAARVPLPCLAGQAMAAVGGLTTTIVFAAGGAVAFAWIAFGLASVATLLAAQAAHILVEDAPYTMRGVRQARKERSAALVGFELPLLASTVLLALGVAGAWIG